MKMMPINIEDVEKYIKKIQEIPVHVHNFLRHIGDMVSHTCGV